MTNKDIADLNKQLDVNKTGQRAERFGKKNRRFVGY